MNNGKLNSWAVKCIFLGYVSESKGYRLWCPDSKKVIQSRDIIFNETVMFSHGKESVSIGNQEDASEKAEYEIPADVSKGGDTLSHSRSEVQSEEVNPNILSPETYSLARDRPRRTIRKPAHYLAYDENGLIAYALAVA